jgi:hypothetical protein
VTNQARLESLGFTVVRRRANGIRWIVVRCNVCGIPVVERAKGSKWDDPSDHDVTVAEEHRERHRSKPRPNRNVTAVKIALDKVVREVKKTTGARNILIEHTGEHAKVLPDRGGVRIDGLWLGFSSDSCTCEVCKCLSVKP